MELIQKSLGDSKLELSVTASAEETERTFAEAEAIFAQHMELEPVEDKSIAQLAQEVLNIDDLDATLVSYVLELLIPRAIDKANVSPAFLPQADFVQEATRGEEFSFSVELMLKPEYELKSYEPVSITVPPFSLEEHEIAAEIAHLAESYASFEPDDPRPVGEGDSISVSMSCSEEGEEVSNLNFENRTYIMGMGLMPSSFDEHILGMEVGETKEFSFTVPAPGNQRGPSDQGKPNEHLFECRVTVNEMQKKIIPAITDTWLSHNMPMYDTVETLKDTIRQALTTSKKLEYDSFIRQMATAELAKRFEGKIVDEVYEAMRDSFMQNLHMQLAQEGMSFEQFVAQNGGDQQFQMMLMMEVRRSLVEGYALDALYRHESMTIDEEDMLEACSEMNPQDPHSVKEQMEQAGYGYALRESAQRFKAGKWLVDQAHIKIDEQTSKGA